MLGVRSTRLAVLALAVLVCLNAGAASAHPTPGSIAFIDFTVDGARIEQDVPIEELERALHVPLAEQGRSAQQIVARHAQRLRAYAGAHLRIQPEREGAPWITEVEGVTGHDADDGPRARLRFTVHAPSGKAAGSVRLHDDIVAHEVISHYTIVYVRSDWAQGLHAHDGPPRLAGTIHAGRSDLSIRRSGGFWRGLRGMVAFGAHHIATGSDHLIFLFALVLVAPVVAAQGRWRGRRTIPATLSVLARVITAFTVGHCVTLTLGALDLLSLPAQFVEPCIAVSILVTALHALRPIFARREAFMAAGFGMIHGLAFANSLSAHDLGRAQMAWTLLGFNTGIELAQLGLLLLVLPWLLLLARTRIYPAFRIAGACTAAGLGAGWLLERTAGLPNPTSALIGWMETHPLCLLVALASLACIARMADREGQELMHRRSAH